MEYTSIDNEKKILGLKNRLAQLEEEHFGSSVYLREAEALNDVTTIQEMKQRMASCDTSWDVIKKELDALEKSSDK